VERDLLKKAAAYAWLTRPPSQRSRKDEQFTALTKRTEAPLSCADICVVKSRTLILQLRQECKQLVALRKTLHFVYTNEEFLGLVDGFRSDMQRLLPVCTRRQVDKCQRKVWLLIVAPF
jgi:hypothetical protein